MDKEISTAIGRLDRYLFRVKRAIRIGDYSQALADTAELSEVARRLWNYLQKRGTTTKVSARSTTLIEGRHSSYP